MEQSKMDKLEGRKIEENRRYEK